MASIKKIALLFGNTRGLNGTQKEILDFMKFLMSPQGGAWGQTEIKGFINLPECELLEEIEKIRNGGYDYVIVYFTGHGGCKDETILEINPGGEQIEESHLFGLAPKQLNILDNCRSLIPGSVPIDDMHDGITSEVKAAIRDEYETLIVNAASQLVRIYSCQEGAASYAYRDGRGSIYSQAFLESAKSLLGSQDVVYIYDCHEKAATTTQNTAKSLHLTQNPEIVPTKCLHSLELPISFNPKCLKTNI